MRRLFRKTSSIRVRSLPYPRILESSTGSSVSECGKNVGRSRVEDPGRLLGAGPGGGTEPYIHTPLAGVCHVITPDCKGGWEM